MLPVYEGEIQCKLLGMGVQVWSAEGEQVWDEPGELVCTVPFPSMPTHFWGKDGEAKYKKAYFSKLVLLSLLSMNMNSNFPCSVKKTPISFPSINPVLVFYKLYLEEYCY